jgi:hypothetical protein
MATVIDSLVLHLGLDPKQFETGAKKTQEILDRQKSGLIRSEDCSERQVIAGMLAARLMAADGFLADREPSEAFRGLAIDAVAQILWLSRAANYQRVRDLLAIVSDTLAEEPNLNEMLDKLEAINWLAPIGPIGP